MYLECETKRIFAKACLGKKVNFSYVNLRILRLANFKNRSLSSGQGLVQIKPNLASDISSAYKIFLLFTAR